MPVIVYGIYTWPFSLTLAYLCLQFPSDAQALQTLPPYHYEPDFKQRLQRSYTTVISELKSQPATRPPPVSLPSKQSHPPSDDDSDSYDSDDSDRPVMKLVSSTKPATTPSDPVLPYRKLLKEVAENPAVHFGFQCYWAREFDKWCACPMGQKLSRGQKNTECRSNKRMEPRAFVAHLISEQESGSEEHCKDHRVVHRFLQCLYSNVYREGETWYSHQAITTDNIERKGFFRVRNTEQFRYVQLYSIRRTTALTRFSFHQSFTKWLKRSKRFDRIISSNCCTTRGIASSNK